MLPVLAAGCAVKVSVGADSMMVTKSYEECSSLTRKASMRAPAYLAKDRRFGAGFSATGPAVCHHDLVRKEQFRGLKAMEGHWNLIG